MSCSGVPTPAAHAERNHSAIFNLRPFNSPADSRFHTTLQRWDAASHDETPRQMCNTQFELKTTDRLESLQARRERPNHSSLKVSGHQPNARINPAGGIISSIQVLRMKGKLHRLGLNELLGSPLDVSIQAGIQFVFCCAAFTSTDL